MDHKTFRYTLPNGLEVLVYPLHNIPKVSVQLWYDVGSKDEVDGNRGYAHLLEHMLFKGTQKLSESDVNLITQKLSGYCNAFTSYDYTCYVYDFPSQNWQQSLSLLADCMRNCTIKEDLLDSELAAVVQELKMYRDDYGSSLVDELVSSIFADHPYHYPIIGYKHDLLKADQKSLVDFYHKYYVPNNATLVVVGDVDPEQVHTLAQESFGHLKPNPDLKKEKFYFNRDIKATAVTMYRDVQQPFVYYAFVVPGARAQKQYLLDIASWILATGKGSRLYKKLVEQKQIATDVQCFSYDLFDHGLFFIQVNPKHETDFAQIEQIIKEEILDIAKNGVKEKELTRAKNKVQVAFVSLAEQQPELAAAWGNSYLATGDDRALFNYLNYKTDSLHKEVQQLFAQYLRPTVMHAGKILPIAEREKEQWLLLQDASDRQDTAILQERQRETDVEPGVLVHSIDSQPFKDFTFAKVERFVLPNDMVLLAHHNKLVPKIHIVLDFKADHSYDPDDQPGLFNMGERNAHGGNAKIFSRTVD